MNASLFLDTNVVIWLATGQSKKITRTATALMGKRSLLYSPMVRLEMEYLHEIGKLNYAADAMLKKLTDACVISESQTLFGDICNQACQIGWTREVFDRLIVAEAMAHDAKLVTSDENILTHYKHAVW